MTKLKFGLLKLRYIIRDIPYFIKNIWSFRKELWDFRPWDYSCNMELLKQSIQQTCNHIEIYGQEIDKTKRLKIHYMKRSIYIIDKLLSHNFLDDAEQRLNKKLIYRNPIFKPLENGDYEYINTLTEEESKNNREIYLESYNIEKEYWKELSNILFDNNDHQVDIFKSNTNYEDYISGKGIYNWWD